MTALDGQYFLPRSSRFVPATLSVGERRALRVNGSDGAALDEASARAVRTSLRLGRVVRRIGFPSGGRFESADNDAVDDFLRAAHARVPGAAIDRIERSWRAAAIAVALALVAIAAGILYGIPQTARLLADATPEDANRIISEQALRILDGVMLQPSKLPAASTAKAQELFARIAREGKRGPQGYRLLIRQGGAAIGPNAFALPDGTVFLTDEMWALAQREDEIEGVFAHEISHVDRRHNLQVLYQAALVPAAIAVITGDISQVSNLAALLPGLLVQAAYSRALEQQADDDAAALLRRIGGDPSALAGLLQRLEETHCKSGKCSPGWLGSHPETHERAQHLRDFPKRPGQPPVQVRPLAHPPPDQPVGADSRANSLRNKPPQ